MTFGSEGFIKYTQCTMKSDLKGATSWFVHFEKNNINFSSSSFVIRVNLSILNHPCSFLVYYYFFGAFLSYQANILWFPSR